MYKIFDRLLARGYTEEQAEKMFEELVKSLAEKEDITEELKANNPMLWTQKMNNIRNRAMEIVNTEMIYN